MSADATRIASNIYGLQALNALHAVNRRLAVHQMRLATGRRINTAGDDPAGLTLATKLRARSEGLGQALSNIADARNMLSVAEGGLNKINDILVLMQTKATQAANDTLGASERAAIAQELQDLAAEIDAIVQETQFNGIKFLDGTVAGVNGALVFQTGSEASEATSFFFDLTNSDFASNTLSVQVGSQLAAVSVVEETDDILDDATPVATAAVTSELTELSGGRYTVEVQKTGTDYVVTLRDYKGNPVTVDADGNPATQGTGTSISVSSPTFPLNLDFGVGFAVTLKDISALPDGTYTAVVEYNRSGHSVADNPSASAFLQDVQKAVDRVATALQKVGSMIARLGIKEENVTTAKINVEAAFNRIMNADMAQEQLEATKYQILQQTAMAMLAQANVAPQGILSLFR